MKRLLLSDMSGFILRPNLPEAKVKSLLIGENNDNTTQFLINNGIECVQLKANPLLDEETKNHADMLCSYCGNGRFVFSQNDSAANLLKNEYNAEISVQEGIMKPYPTDIALNACFINKYLLCREASLSALLKTHCLNNSIKIINTKQGYSKCSVCVVNENSVITEDEGIAYLLNNYQCGVLLLNRGGVYLSDRHCGFIGGCSGLLDKNVMFFNGDVKKHSQYAEIKDFLGKRNIEIICSENPRLTDFGGLIPFLEE